MCDDLSRLAVTNQALTESTEQDTQTKGGGGGGDVSHQSLSEVSFVYVRTVVDVSNTNVHRRALSVSDCLRPLFAECSSENGTLRAACVVGPPLAARFQRVMLVARLAVGVAKAVV